MVRAILSRSALALLMLLLFCSPAAAHNLGAEARVRGDRVEVEAFFDDNTPAVGARVTVQDEAGNTVAEGKTDAKGRWTFPRPAAGKYKLSVDAGAGHRTAEQLTVPATDLAPESAESETISGPARAEFTRPHWDRVALGLGAIAVLAAAWVVCRRRLRP